MSCAAPGARNWRRRTAYLTAMARPLFPALRPAAAMEIRPPTSALIVAKNRAPAPGIAL